METSPDLKTQAYAADFGERALTLPAICSLRLGLVIPGSAGSIFLILCGIRRLFKEGKWAALALTNCVAVMGVYVVLDSIDGRVATGASPRHIAFCLAGFHRTARTWANPIFIE